ncbi:MULTISPECIES: DUF389 domain-containing protein [Pseudanabaena]|jgi:uncharacterized hydrophobic protein (TIGR00271 family)|uniref:DUF389 domain-containing protein n=1 Tax=Pseudanabaena TaxID=1152 RepID=UPI00247AE417|nr:MULTISPECIES: DUF389 domain-containing protein [Pseudanabaena]MEA5488428.1 DUF389 domain-containing protein [Pseudanabaena sp. CCNP1317]WGS70366.1 DUF389 domain-containing protein [Pseudanabaena galeata CCNP1313]
MAKYIDFWQTYRDRLAAQMGVDEQRKTEVYLEISQAATLKDTTHWLQIIFSAGIATLGLVLNSPAVIIGAMLISPLMGPILSLGLALAAGDFILLARGIANITLSCSVAIGFAVLLIFILPFKEATSEILARIQPNTLDLGVALFSGAIGAIAICRPIKGVVTSIPGVSIAVALMPPLCVVGFGVGVAFSLNWSEGFQIAKGGGLLFLTNLVAISFASLLVFLMLHIDTETVRERVKLWESSDRESLAVQNFLGRYVFLKRLRPIGSLPGRLLVVLLTVLALLVPLSSAFGRLGEEVTEKQQQNALRRNATNIWLSKFSNENNGQPRSSIERISITEKNQFVTLRLNVFTSKLYSATEKEEYVQELAQKLGKNPQQIQFILTEIPTASNEILAKKEEVALPVAVKPPSLSELQFDLLQDLDAMIADLSLPPNAQLLDYAMTTGKSQSMLLAITYLSDRPISADAQALVIQDVKTRIGITGAKVNLEYININGGEIIFEEDKIALTADAITKLDQIGSLLQRYPNLKLLMSVNLWVLESNELRRVRTQAIASYLESKWQVPNERLDITHNLNITSFESPNLPQDGKVLFRFMVKPKEG